MRTNTNIRLLTGGLLCFAAVVLILVAHVAGAATLIYLEEPANGSIRSGVGNLRGWAISSEPIDDVNYAVDGEPQGSIPYGGTRRDVGAAYPTVPGSGESGFSMAFNYGNLTPGEHLLEVQAGGESVQARFRVVGFEQEFISGNPEIYGAQVYTGFYSVHLNGAWFPGEGERDLELEWSSAAQQFLIIKNRPHEDPSPPQDPCGFSPPAPGC